LKRNGYQNIGQTIQCVLVPVSSFGVLSYAMYLARQNFDDWLNDINYVRVWIFLESIFFFCWIFSGVLFVASAYLWKLEPTDKDEDSIKLDDNVWNDRDADDFLRYVKYDFYIFSKVLSILFMDIIIGFTNFNDVDTMGPRDMWPIKYVYGMLVLNRFFRLLVKIQKMREGNQLIKTHYSDCEEDCNVHAENLSLKLSRY
jgi:hypothetical protein